VKIPGIYNLISLIKVTSKSRGSEFKVREYLNEKMAKITYNSYFISTNG